MHQDVELLATVRLLDVMRPRVVQVLEHRDPELAWSVRDVIDTKRARRISRQHSLERGNGRGTLGGSWTGAQFLLAWINGGQELFAAVGVDLRSLRRRVRDGSVGCNVAQVAFNTLR